MIGKRRRSITVRYLWLCVLTLLAGSAIARDLAEVRSSGILKVAVYREFAPFNDEGRGIEVDLAKRLADKLGVKVSLLPFEAGENMEDDLRNMVWKGHYLGYGPADVMLHVPVDKVFMERNKQVAVFAPYFRETLQIAWDHAKIDSCETLSPLAGHLIGAEGDSIGSIALLAAENGRLRNNVKHFRSIEEAVKAMRDGGVSAVVGMRSQLEGAMAGEWKNYRIGNPPLPGLPQAGWVVGMAVKSDFKDLARALQQALNELDADGSLDRIFEAHHVKRLRPL